MAMYGLMSAPVWRSSRRVADTLPAAPPPPMTRTMLVRFSKPQPAVMGAHTPGT